MRSSWSEPYLWVHLAGVAAVPICLELCVIGLAASETKLPAALVWPIVALIGLTPIAWMQWQRPFCIFSLTPFVLQPNQLSEPQRRLLRRFKAPIGRGITIAMGLVAFGLLVWIQQWVPFATQLASLVPAGALGGLGLAAIGFLLSHLFLQVPASVLAVLLTPEAKIQTAEPYPVNAIRREFSLIGIPIKQILPPVTPAIALVPPTQQPSTQVKPAAKSPSPPAAPPSSASPTVQTPPSPEVARAIPSPAAQPQVLEAEILDPADMSFTADAVKLQAELESEQNSTEEAVESEAVKATDQATDQATDRSLESSASADAAVHPSDTEDWDAEDGDSDDENSADFASEEATAHAASADLKAEGSTSEELDSDELDTAPDLPEAASSSIATAADLVTANPVTAAPVTVEPATAAPVTAEPPADSSLLIDPSETLVAVPESAALETASLPIDPANPFVLETEDLLEPVPAGLEQGSREQGGSEQGGSEQEGKYIGPHASATIVRIIPAGVFQTVIDAADRSDASERESDSPATPHASTTIVLIMP